MADYSTGHDSLETSSWSLPQRHGKEEGPDKCGTRETSEIKRAFLFHILRSPRFFPAQQGLGVGHLSFSGSPSCSFCVLSHDL